MSSLDTKKSLQRRPIFPFTGPSVNFVLDLWNQLWSSRSKVVVFKCTCLNGIKGLARTSPHLGPWLTLPSLAPGAILLTLWGAACTSRSALDPWHLGVHRNNNNNQGATLYFPEAFHPESSKQFTDQDSSCLSVGPRPSAGVKRGQRALVFLDQGSGGPGWVSESPETEWP